MFKSLHRKNRSDNYREEGVRGHAELGGDVSVSLQASGETLLGSPAGSLRKLSRLVGSRGFAR